MVQDWTMKIDTKSISDSKLSNRTSYQMMQDLFIKQNRLHLQSWNESIGHPPQEI